MMLISLSSSPLFGASWVVRAASAPSNGNNNNNPTSSTSNSNNVPAHEEQQQQLLLDQQRRQLQDAQKAIRQTLEEMKRHSTLAGSIKPLLQKFVMSETELLLLFKSIRAVAHWEDLLIIVMLGWMTVPALQYPYQVLQPNRSFHTSVAKVIAEHVQHVGKLALLVYVVDLIKMVGVGLGVFVVDAQWSHLPHCFAQSLYTIYAANRLVKLKKHYLRAYINRHPEVFGPAKLLNRLVDAVLYGLAFVLVLGYLKVEMGVAVQSVLALGSVGTLAVGLASQGIISQILHGLLLASNARIYEGDSIQLSSGQKGTIVHLGWLETTLRGSDEVMVSIPNADLLKQHVSNLSRVRNCQVTQQLHFRHKDIPKLQELTQSIKQEIQLSCPDVITDGSRPFRAYWTDIAKDGVTVTVDAHFAIRPTAEQYWENRQRVLQAIHRACVLHQVEFHVPALSGLVHSAA
jgi:small-conductance mechanosensitive channel